MANTQFTQEGLAESLRLDQERFNRVTQTLSETEQVTPFTSEGWSVKDFFAHMAHWKQAGHAFLVAYIHDQPLPAFVESGDEPNAKQQRIYSSLSLQEAQSFWQETHTHLLHLIVDELDAEHLNAEVHVPWDEEAMASACELVTDVCRHDAEHFDLIERHMQSL